MAPFSADGAMISLVNKQWVETRTVAIGEPQEKLNAQGEREIHVGKLSYFSRLADASTFTNLAEVELRRRKVAQAREVCAVMDGADWCQLFTERHRPDAVRILDFPHAAEHVTKLLEALEQAGMRFPPSHARPVFAYPQTSRPSTSPAYGGSFEERSGPTKRDPGASGLLAETRSVDAVSCISTTRLADWFWDGGECQQECCRGPSQRGRNALGAQKCQSHAGLTQRHL